MIPERWRLLYLLNRMVGVIDGFRLAICPTAAGVYLSGFLPDGRRGF